MNLPRATVHRPPAAPVAAATQHEHEFEPEYGLPEPLPAGERMLWQGTPDWRAMARQVFHVPVLAGYFALILIVRAATVLSFGGTALEAGKAVLWLSPLVLLALAMVTLMAWLTARTTVYTLTDHRVVMRIGIVLSLTFNLPLRRVASADLRTHADGTGDIPLKLAESEKIAYVHLWPHARPWRLAKPEPSLRCVPDAANVAKVLAQAWSQQTGISVARDGVRDVAAGRSGAAPTAGDRAYGPSLSHS